MKEPMVGLAVVAEFEVEGSGDDMAFAGFAVPGGCTCCASCTTCTTCCCAW